MTAVAATTTRQDSYESATAAKGAENVRQEDFMKLLLAQMTHQDPMNPMQDTAFMGQMAQFQALDEQIAMTKTMLGMRSEMALQGANGLMGKFVVGDDAGDNEISGQVASAALEDGAVYVELTTGQKIAYADITGVSDLKVKEETKLVTAMNMIDMYVAGQDDNGNTVGGVAVGVTVQDDKTYVELDNGLHLPFDNIEVATDPVVRMERLEAEASLLVGKQISGYDQNEQVVSGIATETVTSGYEVFLRLESGKLVNYYDVITVTDPT